MVEIKSRREREKSFLVERGAFYRYTRRDRYFEHPISEARMPKVIREYIDYHLGNTDSISESTLAYIKSADKRYQDSNPQIHFEYAIATYAGNYIIPFLEIGDVECAALKITYNQEERSLLEKFLGLTDSKFSNNSKAMTGLEIICYKLVTDKQYIRIMDELETVGIIYATFPEKDKVIDYGYIQYINSCQATNSFVWSAIRGAILRGVSIDEIEQIIPDNPLARFMSSRGWTDFDIAQVDALMPGIADLA